MPCVLGIRNSNEENEKFACTISIISPQVLYTEQTHFLKFDSQFDSVLVCNMSDISVQCGYLNVNMLRGIWPVFLKFSLFSYEVGPPQSIKWQTVTSYISPLRATRCLNVLRPIFGTHRVKGHPGYMLHIIYTQCKWAGMLTLIAAYFTL